MIRSILLAAAVAAGFLVTARDVAANAKLLSIYAAQGNGGNLQVIGIGRADALPNLADWQYSGDGSWHAGFALPSPGVRLLPSLTVAPGNGGNLQVVGLGSLDNLPYLASWQNNSDGSWHAGFALPSATAPGAPPGAPPVALSSIAMANGNNGNLQVVGIRAVDSLPYLASWQNNSDGSWHAGFALPSPNVALLSSIAMANGNNGNLQVVGLGGADRLPYLASWQNSSDGTWHPGFVLPGPGVRLSSIAVAPGNSGNLQVIGIDAISNLAYLASWQSSSDGTWHAGFPLP
ncbi:hypothetical protein [Polyangium fumosum]|uniref:Uncharacterized protein n=1 Tax=Polyangium fumosum TaxID=889272 RepID=A0A4U1J7Q3_9BACT|nr:hypothetical protein [Polyangium fumosum]TKD03220.1 hypothetical protein E8A74_27295 [Polyangium fumosum]